MLLSIQFMAPQLVFRGKYELAGKLVSLPIAGMGDFNATFSKQQQSTLIGCWV
jgi:hypothetical protein